MSTDAHSASKQRRPNLSPFEERLLKSVGGVTTSLTELSGSWRSMDAGLFLRTVCDLDASLSGIANSLERLAETQDCHLEVLSWMRKELSQAVSQLRQSH